MRNILRVGTIIILVLTISSTKSIGQTTIKEITDQFFKIYATDPVKAVEYGFSTNKWMDKKPDDVSNLKSKLQYLISQLGEYYGYEPLSDKMAGQSTRMLTFIVKYNREPIRFTFLFYKPKDSWQLNNFSYDEDVDKDLEEATKAYRLKENLF